MEHKDIEKALKNKTIQFVNINDKFIIVGFYDTEELLAIETEYPCSDQDPLDLVVNFEKEYNGN